MTQGTELRTPDCRLLAGLLVLTLVHYPHDLYRIHLCAWDGLRCMAASRVLIGRAILRRAWVQVD
jgi:hypothetical protein